MLTFRFTGAMGEMTQSDLLTAGMEGKQVRLEFSQEWDGLRKSVVFVAGGKTCTLVEVGETETIPGAAELLTAILQNGVYHTDQYENILRLNAALFHKAIYTISAQLDHVSGDNSHTLILENDAYHMVLTPEANYQLDTVTVTMGGLVVTASVYDQGVIHIPKVTGDVVISATAKKLSSLRIDLINKGSVSFLSSMGMQINPSSAWRATLVPVGQYMQLGKTYRFDIGAYGSTYAYTLVVLVASEPGHTFPYVAGSTVYYNVVKSRSLDSGWQQGSYSYTPEQENIIFAVNFKRMDGASMTQDDYDILQANFHMEELS